MENEYLPILKNIGLAAKARKITIGNEMTCDAIREGRIGLVLICEDASSNTVKKLLNCCEQNSVEYYRIPVDADTLARSVGKKKALMTVGVTDKNLCVLVRKSILSLSNATSSQKVSESEV